MVLHDDFVNTNMSAKLSKNLMLTAVHLVAVVAATSFVD